MFVHNLLRCWVDTHQRSSPSLVQDRLRSSEAEPRFKSARTPALGIRQGPRRSSSLLLPRGCRATGLLAASLPLLPGIGSTVSLCPSIRLRPSASPPPATLCARGRFGGDLPLVGWFSNHRAHPRLASLIRQQRAHQSFPVDLVNLRPSTPPRS
jgi:hypothetical protein